MTREILRLEEYAQHIIDLQPVERDILLRPELQFDITPIRASSSFAVRPTLVGVVELPSRTVRIQPRFGIRNTLFMMSYSLDIGGWVDITLPLEADDALTDALAYVFVLHVRRAFQRGVLQGYQNRDNVLAVIKGRVRFADQIKDYYGRLPPVEVSHDEFSEDTVENRLIKAALVRLGHLPLRSRDVRQSLAECAAMLDTVAVEGFPSWRIPTVTYTRLNAHYRTAVEFARLILHGTSLEFRDGRHQPGAAFLVDMALVFEDFLATSLKNCFRHRPNAVLHGMAGRSLWLDEERSIRLKPDFSSWRGTACDWVADAKYKSAGDGPRESDVYQLLAYTVAADVHWGVLVYADGKESTHTATRANKQLEVRILDLTKNPVDILNQVASIATRAAEMSASRPVALVSRR
jgi:5-methylcytosine-specific restriction enzyme subunit McrC